MATQSQNEGETELRPVSTVHAFPTDYFVENLAVRPNGDILVTVLNRNELYNVSPAGGDPKATLVHTFATAVSGIVEVGTDIFYVSSGAFGSLGTFVIWKVDLTSFTGGTSNSASVTKLIDIPDAIFLNGSALLSAEKSLFLTVDSLLGTIFRIDVAAPSVTTWYQSQRLTKCTDNPSMPGANGIKLFGSHAYISNSDARELLRVALHPTDPNAPPTGDLKTVMTDCIVDDFAFDAHGAAYLTTHLYNSVVKLTPEGQRSRIAGGPEDREVAGTTACAFARGDGDGGVLYVTTNGGMSGPIGGEVGAGRLLRVEI
ncbi:MAG: hypothetical protein M1833_002737 [Piccolia ochrophora]|nr:MAG: hypothetical protein M1833_002737 [Piccolia ochrophora]